MIAHTREKEPPISPDPEREEIVHLCSCSKAEGGSRLFPGSDSKENPDLTSKDFAEASLLTSDQDAMEASHLTPSQQRILGLIVERLSRTGGSACCTKREIARIAKCSAKTVDRAIARLRAEGIIETCECFNENGSQEGNAYRLSRWG